MDTTRQQKINRLIQKELSELFRKETAQMRGVLVTVSTVRVTPDLGLAKVYLSIFPSEQGKEILINVKNSVKTLRYELGQKVGKQLRIIPELAFYLDDSLDYLENIDRLLSTDDKKED